MKKLLLLLMIGMISCQQDSKTSDQPYQETYRPQFHFSPARNWTNDPNGLVYYQDEFHLFYQYNPQADVWGHMSWGHAVSKDLLHWEHLPIAIPEYVEANGDSIEVFSGTVVVDKGNTSGLGTGPDCLIAIYTSNVHANNQGLRQHQSLAYSNDKGRTWTRYNQNPILDIQRKDFRDPKVFWYEEEKKWVMALVVPDQMTVQFYESKNLLQWTLTGTFANQGDTSKIWECPDLYRVPLEHAPDQFKWVLSMSCSHPQGKKYVGMQYFTGTFDGKTFVADEPTPVARYVDYGRDFYAGIVFNNFQTEEGSPVMIGWANNWAYARETPTAPWRGAMSMPRILRLRETTEGLLLVQQPWKGLSTLCGDFMTPPAGTSLHVVAELDAAEESGIHVFENGDQYLAIGYRPGDHTLYVDRSNSGRTDFHPDFTGIDSALLQPKNGKIHLDVWVDGSYVEVFANEGEKVLSVLAFPTGTTHGVSAYGKATFLVQPVASAWNAPKR